MSGWIKVHRKMRGHWVMNDPRHAAGWLAILMHVNYRPAEVPIGAHIYHLEAGESCRSVGTWADVLPGKWTRANVRTFLKLLENAKMITTRSTNKTTILKVVNYDTYQTCQPAEQPSNNHQTTSSQPATNQQPTTVKEVKTGKNLRREELTGQNPAPADMDLALEELENNPEQTAMPARPEAYQRPSPSYSIADVLVVCTRFRMTRDNRPEWEAIWRRLLGEAEPREAHLILVEIHSMILAKNKAAGAATTAIWPNQVADAIEWDGE